MVDRVLRKVGFERRAARRG
ncbi:hypothetical protein AB0R11_25465 [Streptomyces fradiae]